VWRRLAPSIDRLVRSIDGAPAPHTVAT
jgi:hypothetical protein